MPPSYLAMEAESMSRCSASVDGDGLSFGFRLQISDSTLQRVKVFGLTGGIGMGKSTADKLLRDRGIPVVDTDLLAREIVEPGQPALAEVRQLFGQDFIGPDGRVRRDELARHVFADPALRKQLEDILHPRIRSLWQSQIAEWRGQAHSCAVVVIPLLFETNAEPELDATICVACSAETQRQRLLARGWNSEEFAPRLRGQWPFAKKIAKADYLVWTEGDLEVHAAQLDRILHQAGVH